MRAGDNKMSNIDVKWKQEILERFGGRENLSRDELYVRYFEGLGLLKDDVFECLKLIEDEYKLPAGLLRPDDRLERLFDPVAAKNPWQWLVYRTREGDSETEINYELGKRMRRSGTVQSWSHVEKFGDLSFLDLIRAWCGLTPTGE
jgi:hypothetical protein